MELVTCFLPSTFCLPLRILFGMAILAIFLHASFVHKLDILFNSSLLFLYIPVSSAVIVLLILVFDVSSKFDLLGLRCLIN